MTRRKPATPGKAITMRIPFGINAILRKVAAIQSRSISGQVGHYVKKGLIADGYLNENQPTGE